MWPSSSLAAVTARSRFCVYRKIVESFFKRPANRYSTPLRTSPTKMESSPVSRSSSNGAAAAALTIKHSTRQQRREMNSSGSSSSSRSNNSNNGNGSSSKSGSSGNRLVKERSPYLLQHATNPVQWYPWCDEAIEKAKRENKLIFLSVGYSTCHWCHVMEYESFQNHRIAAIMNQHFVNIKVDREERPDVDVAYMNFIRLACGQAGWPMSVFLAPDLNPIGGGTYFPPQDRWGRGGFESVLLAFAEKWKKNPQELRTLGANVAIKLAAACGFHGIDTATLTDAPTDVPKTWQLADACFEQLFRRHDRQNGGFELAPKFPQPCISNFLLHYYHYSLTDEQQQADRNASSALSMVTRTLRQMSKGGIRDHIGGGFARYSTDERWHVPHFEKMLYDQAQLSVVYATTYSLTNETVFRDVVDDILTYVYRHLRYKKGGFFSAEDADSLPSVDSTRKREGAFYVWKWEEIETHLSQPLETNPSYRLADLFAHHYNVRPQGNVHPCDDVHGEFVDQNVLFVSTDNESETAARFALTVEQVRQELNSARRILYDKRNDRPRPRLDTKIIASWNGLMLSGYSKAARILRNDFYEHVAVQAASFLLEHVWSDDENRLLRCCYVDEQRENVVQASKTIHGFLNDYVFLVRGLLDLYECTYDWRWIEWCERLQLVQDELFWNERTLIYDMVARNYRFSSLPQKEDEDGAQPCGNSVCVHNLLRLSCLLGRRDLTEKAGHILSSFASRLSTYPDCLPEMVAASMMYHIGPAQIIVFENGDKEEAARMLSVVHEFYMPNRVSLLVRDDNDESVASTERPSPPFYRRLPIVVEMAKANGGKFATAIVCRNRSCAAPICSTDALRSLLASSAS